MQDIKLQTELKTSQQLLLSLSMQKALHILQLPLQELITFVEAELEANPALERCDELLEENFNERICEKNPDSFFSKVDEDKKNTSHEIAESSPSLYNHLMTQARLYLSSEQELLIAEEIIGNLSDEGLLKQIPSSLLESFDVSLIEKVLNTLKLLEPVGICCADVQESLLLQLKAQGKESSITFQIIKSYYEKLLQQRFSFLAKRLDIELSLLKEMLKKDLALLDPFPGLRFHKTLNPNLIPDIYLIKDESSYKIKINDKGLPKFKLNTTYQSLFPRFSKKEQRFLIKHYHEAKWMVGAVKKRGATLLTIMKYIIKKQPGLLNSQSNELAPMTASEIAQEVGLSESTITRAISDKYLCCERGIIPLKSLFSQAICKSSSVSSASAKDLLKKIILEENNLKPLSDLDLVKKMRRMGFSCARRTITKYRKSLRIEASSKRKLH